MLFKPAIHSKVSSPLDYVYCYRAFITIMSNLNSELEVEKEKFAIEFANFLDNLSYTDKISLWSKNGEYKGIYKMDNDQLMEKFKSKRLK